MVDILSVVPGVTTARDRAALLSLAGASDCWQSIPDSALDSWDALVAWLSQQALEKVIPFAITLLEVVAARASLELSERALALASKLAKSVTDRSLAMFLARMDVEQEAGSGSAAFSSLDTVFVAPAQYEFATQLLENEHVLFILGDPHMGKTFSALHILWEHFHARGRSPVWIRSNIFANLATGGVMTVDLFRDVFLDNSTVYLEDPFGRTVPLSAVDFVRELRRVIFMAKSHDVRIIITSRTSLFKGAVGSEFAEYIVHLSQELTIGRSYSSDELADIAMLYMRTYKVAWTANLDSGLARVVAQTIGEQLQAPPQHP